MQKCTRKGLLKVKPRNLKEGDLVLKVLKDKTFDKIEYTIILRAQNQFVDALATGPKGRLDERMI